MSGAYTTYSLDTLPQTLVGGPVSSQYILYANGVGQSYWAPTVSYSTINDISTLANESYAGLSTSIQLLTSSFVTYSTTTLSTISTVNGLQVSSIQSLDNKFGLLSNQFNIFSNGLTSDFQGLSNNLTIQVNSIYTSSIDIVYSTLQAISSISSFTGEIGDVRNLAIAGLSSLSTAITTSQASTTSALLQQTTSSLNAAVASSIHYTNHQISSLSTVLATQSSLSVFSTQINLALLSSATNVEAAFGAGVSSLYFDLLGFEASTFSTQTWAISTLSGIESRVGSLESLSTSLSSLTIQQISSYVSPLFMTTDTKFSGFTSTLQQQISSVYFSTVLNIEAISTISTTSFFNNSSLQGQITTTSNNLSTLTYQFNVLQTSSILAGIYDTFIGLQAYTTLLINSTINSTDLYKAGLSYSTTLQNTSTANGFFTAFVSSAYLSTISTLVPITTAFLSTTISTLYSTSWFILNSTLNSTVIAKNTEFTSTNTSLTNQIVLSSQNQLNSSILGYLSTPAAQALNTFSTQGAQAISTFTGQGLSTLRTQSTLFGSTFTTNQSLVSTLVGSGNSTISVLQQTQSTYTSLFPTLFNSFQISSIVQLSTQTTQFTSTMTGYGTTLNFVIGSTNSAVLAQTTNSANTALNTLVVSTTNTYNTFVANLLATTSTIGLSSLYTVQNITLTSNNFEGTMDLGAFTNFNIQVAGPLVSGSSNYRISHTSNINLLNYRRGIITVDVSTIGSGYSNNAGQLCLDVYRWGLPTTVWGTIYPTISSADYMAMYEYTIQNSIVYTNLLNVYPRLRISALSLRATQVYNVFTGTSATSNFFWRGSPIQLQWSNYSHFPFGAVGAPPYSPEILVDVLYNNQLQSRSGPYDLSVSTINVNLPYYNASLTNPVTTTIRTYFAGKQAEPADLVLQVLVPKFQEVRLTPGTGKFVSLQEIEAWSDTGSNLFLNTTEIGLYGTAAGSNLALGGSNAAFGRANAVDGNTTSVTIGPTTVGNPDANAYLQLLPNLTATTTAISTLMVYNVPSACNQARGSGDGATELESSVLRANVLIGATQYYSTFRLNTSAVQRFAF
jgi:hypothetical protein